MNKSMNHVAIFLFHIYANFRQPDLFEVAEYLLFVAAKYK